jgi:hypothetical protein
MTESDTAILLETLEDIASSLRTIAERLDSCAGYVGERAGETIFAIRTIPLTD